MSDVTPDNAQAGIDYIQRTTTYNFIDTGLMIDPPVRYAAYGWPAVPGGEPQLLEEYTYFNITLNVGLTDEDFSPDNPNYNFPAR